MPELSVCTTPLSVSPFSPIIPLKTLQMPPPEGVVSSGVLSWASSSLSCPNFSKSAVSSSSNSSSCWAPILSDAMPASNSALLNLPLPVVSKARNKSRSLSTTSDASPTCADTRPATRFSNVRSNLLSFGYMRMFKTMFSWLTNKPDVSPPSTVHSCELISLVVIRISAGVSNILSAKSKADCAWSPNSSRRQTGWPTCSSMPR
mmetsp:Transcript_54833/g.166625  ORF Transcript_54833/g.166625 Transcript_54833/m.166625 type:complete len:204 (-) Transcript_54833:919-1530(-)